MQAPEELQVSVFSVGRLSDLGALIFFTIGPKCQFCQKIASYPCQIRGWWGHVGLCRHYLLRGDHRRRGSVFLSALRKPLSNRGVGSHLS